MAKDESRAQRLGVKNHDLEQGENRPRLGSAIHWITDLQVSCHGYCKPLLPRPKRKESLAGIESPYKVRNLRKGINSLKKKLSELEKSLELKGKEAQSVGSQQACTHESANASSTTSEARRSGVFFLSRLRFSLHLSSNASDSGHPSLFPPRQSLSHRASQAFLPHLKALASR